MYYLNSQNIPEKSKATIFYNHVLRKNAKALVMANYDDFNNEWPQNESVFM